MTSACPLAKAQEAILRRWEVQSRLAFEAASDQDRYLLRDHLPNLIRSLCRTLCGEPAEDAVQLSKIHGRQRFSIGDYELGEVLGEYTILKNIVLDVVLTAGVTDVPRTFKMIGTFFDEAAATAASEFSSLREAQLKTSAKKLEELNSELERFSAVAAHDLRSPIGSIIGFLDIIAEDDNLSDTSRTSIARGEAAGRRCLNLIDKLLNYASVGQGELVQTTVSLDEVTGHAIDHLKSEIGTDVRIEVGGLGAVTGDPDLLTQLLQNLIGNSLKYGDPRRAVVVKVSGEFIGDDRLEISVRDNGVGFDPALAAQIFKPFVRAHAKSDVAGAGLGLATCQKIVEMHGGSIHAETSPGLGTTVSFTLPAANQA